MFRLQQTGFFDHNKVLSVLSRAPQKPFPEYSHAFHEMVLFKSGYVWGGRLPYPQQQQSELLLRQIAEENSRQDDCSSVMSEALFSQLAVLLWRTHQQGDEVSYKGNRDQE
ncbi:MAG TPA: hypothetical protein VJY31_02620 [Buttiauxella sp.]|nr:hypothetical protein [Buttiauxella sp.]